MCSSKKQIHRAKSPANSCSRRKTNEIKQKQIAYRYVLAIWSDLAEFGRYVRHTHTSRSFDDLIGKIWREIDFDDMEFLPQSVVSNTPAMLQFFTPISSRIRLKQIVAQAFDHGIRIILWLNLWQKPGCDVVVQSYELKNRSFVQNNEATFDVFDLFQRRFYIFSITSIKHVNLHFSPADFFLGLQYASVLLWTARSMQNNVNVNIKYLKHC